MKLTVLGSGTAVPHPDRSNPGFWLETGAGSVLLDCGPSVPARMAFERLDWPELDAIWISHFHLDHVGGLAPFLFGIRNATEIRKRTKPLQIFGPVGLRDLIEKFDRVNNYRLFKQPFPVSVCEVEPLEKFEIFKGIEAVACLTPHTVESLAIHIRSHNDKTLVYSSDTGFTETLAAFASLSDLLILECAFLRDRSTKIHLELAEAIFLIRKARPKRAMLTHFYREWDEVEFAVEVAAFDPKCEVIEAVDGLRIEI